MSTKSIIKSSSIKNISAFLNKEYRSRRKNAIKTIIRLNNHTIINLTVILDILKKIYKILNKMEEIPFNMYDLSLKLRKILKCIKSVRHVIDEAYYTVDNYYGIGQKIKVISKNKNDVTRIQFTDYKLSTYIIFESSHVNIERIGLLSLERTIENMLESNNRSEYCDNVCCNNTRASKTRTDIIDADKTHADNIDVDKFKSTSTHCNERLPKDIIREKLNNLFKIDSLRIDGKENMEDCEHSRTQSQSQSSLPKEKECGYDGSRENNNDSNHDVTYISNGSSDENLMIEVLENFVENRLQHYKHKVRNAMYIVGIEQEEHKSQIKKINRIS